MQTKVLTVGLIEAARPSSKEYEIRDLRVPKLALVVGSLKKSFKFVSRIPGEKSTRFLIGEFPRGASEEEAAKALADARETAALWTAQVSHGLNPIKEAKQERILEALVVRATFRSVLIDFLETMPKRKRNRTAHNDIRLLKRELLDEERNPFLNKPIDAVAVEDIEKLLDEILVRPAQSTARIVFWQLNKFFRWIRKQGRLKLYNVHINPLDFLESEDYCGSGKRDRHLSAAELRCLWLVITKLEYPLGPYYVMLLLTGQRKSEVAGARWSEIDLVSRTWTIPSHRYKTGTAQLVALSEPLVQLLTHLKAHRGNSGDLVFSHTGGATQMNSFSKAVARLRKQVASEFAKQNPGVSLPHWVLHDWRRTTRTQLAALGVPIHIAKLIMGHGKEGMDKVYDQHTYIAQMRQGLELWAKYLVAISEESLPTWIEMEPYLTLPLHENLG